MEQPELVAARAVKRDFARIVFACGILFYVLRVMGAVWRTDLRPFFPDSFSYVDVADVGPFHPRFWFSERPVGMPLLLWFCGTNLRLFFLVQTLVFAGSVAILGQTVLSTIRSRLIGWVTVAAVVAAAAQPRVGLWHLEALSESLGLSLGILTLALWIRVGAQPGKRTIAYAALATAAWTLTRDVHAVSAIVVIVVLILVSRAKSMSAPSRRTAVRSAAALTVVVLYVVLAQAVSDRNQYPLMNNVGMRVLPDASMTESFIDRGMPAGEALAARSGSDTWDDDSAFLTSPDLASFRDWVKGDGQFAYSASLVLDADFWIGETVEVLPAALAYDFADYDRFQTSQRLPDKLFWFGGVHSGTAATVLVALAGLGLVTLASFARRRALVMVLAAAGVICALDIYVSASSDAVEVLRHLVGPALRVQLLGFIAIGIALDALWTRMRGLQPGAEELPRIAVRHSTAAASAAGTIGLFIAWVGLESRSQDFDPQYTRTIVERAATFGGSYYQNGIHNKGPLETAVYDSVRWFTSADSYWFGIAMYVILAAFVIGAALGLVARASGASRSLAAVVVGLVILHFTVSTSDYAGVLYSRNITVALLAGVAALTLWPRPWVTRRRATITFIVCAIAIGLAVQTLLTTVLAGSVLAVHLIVERSHSTSLRHPVRTLLLSISCSIASAPAWYSVRGSFDEFWSGWWTYARFMSSGTGRSLVDQIGQGFTSALGYYQERPEAVLVVVAFVAVTRNGWTTMTASRRRLHILASAWFVAAWAELVLAQRYSSHYFSVLAVPTLMMAVIAGLAVLGSPAFGRLTQPGQRPGTTTRTALVAFSVLILMQGTDIVWSGVEGASKFRNFEKYAADQRQFDSGATRTTRAVLDLVSTRGDALLAWTMYPWTYLEHQRIPATRFIWKSFLIGEIYLGRTSPEYILPRTSSWFEADLAESRPTTFVRPTETVLIEGTPMDAALREFDQVYLGPDVEVRFRREIWREILAPGESIDLRGSDSPLDLSAADLSDTGWTVDVTDGPSATFGATMSSVPLRLLSKERPRACWRIDAVVRRPTIETDDGLRIVFDSALPGATTRSETDVHLGVDFARAWSGNDSVRFLEQPLDVTDVRQMNISVLIGTQSAALLVDGRIVAAVGLTGLTDVSLEALSPTLEMTSVRFSPIDALYGC